MSLVQVIATTNVLLGSGAAAALITLVVLSMIAGQTVSGTAVNTALIGLAFGAGVLTAREWQWERKAKLLLDAIRSGGTLPTSRGKNSQQSHPLAP